MTIPIADLHCDLLSYLEGSKGRTPSDLAARCALPQLREGGVRLQIMAIFTVTAPRSVEKAMRQLRIFELLPVFYPADFVHHSSKWDSSSPQIAALFAIENASGFCGEEEPLKEGISRLRRVLKSVPKPLYISFTWNGENRFGGGALASAGLKEDGKRLLEELHGQKIAVDLSHASDALAYETIDYIEGLRLDIPLMASHSNARAIIPVPRNLPDEIAREIFRRKGIVGLNFYRDFVGENEGVFAKHIAHWLEIGGKEGIAFGADFFYEGDSAGARSPAKQHYLKAYQNASAYPRLLNFFQKELRLENSILHGMAHQNAFDFIRPLA